MRGWPPACRGVAIAAVRTSATTILMSTTLPHVLQNHGSPRRHRTGCPDVASRPKASASCRAMDLGFLSCECTPVGTPVLVYVAGVRLGERLRVVLTDAFTAWAAQVLLPRRMRGIASAPLPRLEEVRTMLAETVREWTEQWVEQRIEQGLERGIEQGRAQGIRAGLRRRTRAAVSPSGAQVRRSGRAAVGRRAGRRDRPGQSGAGRRLDHRVRDRG